MKARTPTGIHRDYELMAFLAFAAIGSASFTALNEIRRSYRLLPLLLEGSFGSKWKHPMAVALTVNQVLTATPSRFAGSIQWQ
jgi:hypothetical protein